MDLDDIIDLATAGELLGRSPSTLRNQVKNGRFDARLVGKTWITTRQEVERYRQEQLGQVGRPTLQESIDRMVEAQTRPLATSVDKVVRKQLGGEDTLE